MEKQYSVYYIIKANCHEYINRAQIWASTAKEAKEQCIALVYKNSGRHAFHVTTKMPKGFDETEQFPIKLDIGI